VLGIDRSENMLARAHAQTQDPGVTYVLADIDPWCYLRRPSILSTVR
jgi:trans-aconitate methyltransferase